MQETFHQYTLITELANKYSHSTYLASPTNEPESQMVLTLFASSLFRFPHEHENLLKKAQCIKELQHPHVAPILDIGIEQEQLFIVREYWPNGSLRSRLKKLSSGRLELGEALAVVSQVGQALVSAHERNIIHGNMKPENILLDADGQVILTDFSLLDRKDALIRDQTSQEYAFCYLAPEQFTGRCDARSDQYALGCLAYELITGSVPFAAQSLASMMGQPNSSLPIPLSESVAGLPPSLEVAVLKSLAKEPDERFFDFSLFLEVIQSVLSPPPAFPLLRSASSTKKKASSHLVPSAIALTDTASTMKQETDTISQHAFNDAIIGASTPLTSSLEGYSSESQLVLPAIDEEEKMHEEYTSELSVEDTYGQRDDPTRKSASSLTSSVNRYGVRQYSRRRILELAFLCAAIMAVICSIIWLSEILTSSTDLHTAEKKIQIGATLTKNMPTMNVTTTVTYPSDQPTALPTPQLSPGGMLSLQPSPSMSRVAISPTVVATPISYEAEAPNNTLGGSAQIGRCSGCSGGEKVINMSNGGILQFNNVSEKRAGNYTLTLYYLNANSDRMLYISVNGGSTTALTVPGTGDRNTIGTLTVVVMLNGGDSTITFSNPSSAAPDIDRMVV